MSTTMMNILTTSTTFIPTKSVMSTTMILSLMISTTAIKIQTTSTKMVKTKKTLTTLIQKTILIMSSYVIIPNAVKVLISFKNMVNLRCMLFNSFKNLTQIYARENSNTLVLEQNNITLQFSITYVINAIKI